MIDTAPLFALALSIKLSRRDYPKLERRAENGDEEALRSLLDCIALAFPRIWRKIQRLAREASWMSQYKRTR